MNDFDPFSPSHPLMEALRNAFLEQFRKRAVSEPDGIAAEDEVARH